MKYFLHIGCGPCYIESTREVEWVNTDSNNTHKVDLWMNVDNLDMDIKKNSMDGIWTCHMLEHLEYPTQACQFLKAAHHVLRPSGVIRIAVPDLQLIAEAYVAGSDLHFIYGKDHEGYYYKKHSLAERFHYFMHAWEHKMVYDYELLRALLLDAGFSKVEKSKAYSSVHPEFCHDRYISESLYVEATK